MPWRPSPLLRFLAGSSVSSGASKRAGSAQGFLSSYAMSQSIRRQRALAAQAKLDAGTPLAALSAPDLRALPVLQTSSAEAARSELRDRSKDSGQSLKGFLGNAAHGVGAIFTGIPGGVYELGAALVEDARDNVPLIGRGNKGPGGSAFERRILHPTLSAYAAKYGPAFKGDFRSTWNEIYKDPTGTALDAAALVTGGAATASKAGKIGQANTTVGTRANRIATSAANIKSVEGRSPIVHRLEGVGETRPLERYYSRGPIFKGVQKYGMDPLVNSRLGNRKLPGIRSSLNDQVALRVLNKNIDRDDASSHFRKDTAVEAETRGMKKALNNLSREEGTALVAVLNGINDAEKIAAAREQWRRGKAGQNPDGHNLADFGGVDEGYTDFLTRDNPVVDNLIQNPTEGMMKAAEEWHNQVGVGREKLDIDEDVHQERTYGVSRLLTGKTTAELADETAARIESGELKIAPTYVPHVSAAGMTWDTTGKRGKLGIREKEASQGELRYDGEVRNPLAGPTPENVMRSPFQSYLQEQDLATFMSGAVRMDPKILVQHIAQRERNLIDQAFNDEFMNKHGLRDADGELITAKTQGELNKLTGTNGKYVLLHPDLAVKWFNAEGNLIEQISQIARDHGVSTPGFNEKMQNLIETNGQAFVKNELGAMKTEGYAVTRETYDRIKANVDARDPFNSKTLRGYVRFLNTWRKYTLSLMPRWLVNTVIGSAFLNTLKGVGPSSYLQAARIVRHKGDIGVDDLPPLTRLGQMQSELHEANPMNVDSNFNRFKLPNVSNIMYKAVQNAEDYFRTASFIHSLGKAERAHMSYVGDIVTSKNNPNLWGKSDDARLRELMENPKLVTQALDEVNIFSYNYSQLGPFERKYVRLAIPFWGWYKFITKLAWRLPVEYPGRALTLNTLSSIGHEQEKDLGSLPPWVKGSIILNISKDKRDFKYLPALGMNPFGQFGNPFSKEGKMAGTLSLGQMSPPIQSALAGMGISAFGSPTPISPIEGVSYGFYGNPYLLSGRDGAEQMSSVGERGAGRRMLGTLMRAFPQLRLAETASVGGRGVYPESIPLLSARPMATSEENRKDVSLPAQASTMFGLQPRKMDLRHYQVMFQKQVAHAEAKRRTALRAMAKDK